MTGSWNRALARRATFSATESPGLMVTVWSTGRNPTRLARTTMTPGETPAMRYRPSGRVRAVSGGPVTWARAYSSGAPPGAGTPADRNPGLGPGGGGARGGTTGAGPR